MRRFPSSFIQLPLHADRPSVFAIGMLIGAVWYFSAASEPSFSVLVSVAGVAATGLVWARLRGGPGAAFLALAVFGISLGALAGGIATQRLAHTHVQETIGPVLVEGWIQDAQPADRGVRLVLRVHAIDGVEPAETPRKVRMTHILGLETEPGRFVRCWAVLRPPPAPIIAGDYQFDRQAWYDGLGAVGYVQGRCRGGTLGAPLGAPAKITQRVAQIRRQVARHVRDAAGERAGGFAAALASGDRSFMRPEDQEALRGSGLAHLLAISGLHMGIVGGLVFLFVWHGLALIEPIALRWSVKKPAACAALTACAAYLIISGASVSTQRAFVMALVLFGAVLADRAALTQRSLAVAMIIIIVIAPWSVLTPGFQMSFAATAALIAVYEAWQRQRKADSKARGSQVTFWLKSLAVTSVVSSLATMPFALFHFNRVAGLGMLANLAAMPIISLVSAPLAGLALLLAPIGLEEPVLRLFGLSLEAVLAIAHSMSSDGFARGLSWPRMPEVSLAAFSAVIVVICLGRRGRAQTILIASAFIAGGLFWTLSASDRIHWAPSGEVFLEQANGAVTRIAWIKGDGLAPLQFSDTPVESRCGPGEVCELTIGGHTILLTPRVQPSDCADRSSTKVILTLEPGDLCAGTQPHVIAWSDVVQENGISLTRLGAGFRKQRKLKCGQRSWRPCRPPD